MKARDEGSAPEVFLQIEDTESSYTVSLRADELVLLGRGEHCRVCLRTARASREHAELRLVEGVVEVTDKGSANGTYVNEERVEMAALGPSDVLRIGGCRIRLAPVPTSAPAAGDSGAEGEAPPPRRGASQRGGRGDRARAPKASGGSGGLSFVLLLIVAATALCLLAIEYRERLPSWARGLVDAVIGDTREPTAGSDGTTPAIDRRRSSTDALPTAGGPLDAWGRVLSDLDEGPWSLEEARTRLRAYQEEHPEAAVLQRVPDLVTVLESIDSQQSAAESSRLIASLEAAEDAGRYGEVVRVAEFLAAASSTSAERERWSERADLAESRASDHFAGLEQSLEELLRGSRPEQALKRLLEEHEQLGGTTVFRRQLPRYIEKSEKSGADGFASDPRVVRMMDERARAFEECRFGDMRALDYTLLTLDPPAMERAEIAEDLVEATHLQQMFREFLDALKEGTVEVSLSDDHKGRVLGVKRGEVEYEVDYKGRPVQRRKRPWDKIEPLKKYALFRGVSHRPGGVLGLALFAFRVGHEEAAHAALHRLRRASGTRELVDAVVARRLGVPIPKRGFVFHEGRFMTPEAKTERVAAARERRREERLARTRLRELKRDGRLTEFLSRARELRRSGLFTLAQQILLELARRFPQTPPGIEAQRLVDDPLLARHVLEENGRSANRLDMFFLAEGYPAEDGDQESFLVVSNRAMNILCAAEPYKSYRPYFNFHAVQLGSAERGVDRSPGDVERDTALDGKIDWDVFAVSRQKVHELLSRMGEAGEDRQAVVLGNDTASVATGGGGVASVCKTVLSVLAHEVGHSLGGLQDEYDYWPGNDPRREGLGQRAKGVVPTSSHPPNIMRGSDRDEVLEKASWRKWIEAPEESIWNGAGVGVFEGGDHTPFAAWRPQANCRMRTASVGFCVVCMEAMVKSIYRYVRPIDRVEPEATSLELRAGEKLEVRAWKLEPLDHSLEARWFLGRLPDAAPDARTTVVVPREEKEHIQAYRILGRPDGVEEVAWLRWRDVEPGRYRLRLEVHDPTPWVLTDDEELLRDERSWQITVFPRGQ